MAVALVIPAVYSMLIIQFSNRSEDYIGLATSANALGLFIGPFLAQCFFQISQWKTAQLAFSAITAIWSVIVMIFVLSFLFKIILDSQQPEQERHERAENQV